MFGLQRKSLNGNGVVRWEWMRGRAVTGHKSHNGKFVDVRNAQMSVYIGEEGDLFVEFLPAKGVQTPPAVFTAEVLETTTNRFGRCQAFRIAFTFFDKDIEMKLPRRHRILLD